MQLDGRADALLPRASGFLRCGFETTPASLRRDRGTSEGDDEAPRCDRHDSGVGAEGAAGAGVAGPADFRRLGRCFTWNRVTAAE